MPRWRQRPTRGTRRCSPPRQLPRARLVAARGGEGRGEGKEGKRSRETSARRAQGRFPKGQQGEGGREPRQRRTRSTCSPSSSGAGRERKVGEEDENVPDVPAAMSSSGPVSPGVVQWPKCTSISTSAFPPYFLNQSVSVLNAFCRAAASSSAVISRGGVGAAAEWRYDRDDRDRVRGGTKGTLRWWGQDAAWARLEVGEGDGNGGAWPWPSRNVAHVDPVTQVAQFEPMAAWEKNPTQEDVFELAVARVGREREAFRAPRPSEV